MNGALQAIPLINLIFAFIPVMIVVFMLARWSMDARTVAYAIGRMLLQLLLIGYALNWIFAGDSSLVVVLLLTAMLGIASWIAMRPLQQPNSKMFFYILRLIAISLMYVLSFVDVYRHTQNPDLHFRDKHSVEFFI